MIYTPEFAPYQPKRACPICLYNPPLRLRETDDYTPRRAA